MLLVTIPNNSIVKSNPYTIYNDGVGYGPLPVEVGMAGQIIGGYTLLYDSPNETGYAMYILRNSTNIIYKEVFYEQTTYIEREVPVVFNPNEWSPGVSGQIAIVELDIVVFTNEGVIYENSTMSFYIQRATPVCEIHNVEYLNDGMVAVSFKLFNEHNSEYKISGLFTSIKAILNDTILAENVSKSDKDGLIWITFIPENGKQTYIFELTTTENDDYVYGFFQFKTIISSEPNNTTLDETPTPIPATTTNLVLFVIAIIGISIVILGLIAIYRKITKKGDIEII